jgi:thiamine biosynthesis lipoprotein
MATSPNLDRRAWLGWAAGLVVVPSRAMVREERVLFGSPMELLLPAEAPRHARDEVLAGLAAMNARWNAWKPGDLDDLNAALRNGRPHVTPPALLRMIDGAATLETASQGHFNPAIGAWVGGWGFHDDVLRPGAGPDAASIARWRAQRPSLQQLRVHGNRVSTSNRAVQLDFGAYAKGIALDWALDRLARHGVRDALLNLGGNLAAMGHVDGRAWRIGIRDPHGPGLAAMLALQGREAVVTSGRYERWRLIDGVRRTHILDPATGVPATGLDSVTVVHRDAAVADAAATALLVAGPQRWAGVAQRMGIDQALVIDQAGHQVCTSSFATRQSHVPGRRQRQACRGA